MDRTEGKIDQKVNWITRQSNIHLPLRPHYVQQKHDQYSQRRHLGFPISSLDLEWVNIVNVRTSSYQSAFLVLCQEVTFPSLFNYRDIYSVIHLSCLDTNAESCFNSMAFIMSEKKTSYFLPPCMSTASEWIFPFLLSST